MSETDDVLQRMTGSPAESPARREMRAKLARHLDAAHNLAAWLCRDTHNALDIVQEALLRALESSDQCRSDEPRTWLLKIVRNTFITWQGRERARWRLPFTQDVFSLLSRRSNDPRREFDRLQQVKDVRRAIASLPDEFREAIVLREIEGLSYKEVADVLEVPIGTVMSRLSRARERLKELLAEYRGEVFE